VKINLVGKKFGRLTVTHHFDKYYWSCLCSCGNTGNVLDSNLRTGKTKSCGCLNKELVIKRSYKHGDNRRGKTKRLYNIWAGMNRRCYGKTHKTSHRYRDRGIEVCDEWKDYPTFKSWAILNGYQNNLTIDRVDNDGNYEPNNCQWLTRSENAKKYWRIDYGNASIQKRQI